MAVKLVVAPDAELDITEAYIWCETRRVGLGEEFLSALDACIERIRRQPLIYPVVHEAYRRALIRRFPYAIFFELAETTATVYAVFHTSRDPEKWRQRLP
jgi:plasmid stabilization system protein ParE